MAFTIIAKSTVCSTVCLCYGQIKHQGNILLPLWTRIHWPPWFPFTKVDYAEKKDTLTCHAVILNITLDLYVQKKFWISHGENPVVDGEWEVPLPEATNKRFAAALGLLSFVVHASIRKQNTHSGDYSGAWGTDSCSRRRTHYWYDVWESGYVSWTIYSQVSNPWHGFFQPTNAWAVLTIAITMTS